MSRRQALRCRAQRSHGRGPCGNFAMVGGTVCHAHGGMAPQVRAAAARRAREACREELLRQAVEHHRGALIRRWQLIARVLGCSLETAAGPYAALLARWHLEDDPRAGGLSAAERNQLAPRRLEEP